MLLENRNSEQRLGRGIEKINEVDRGVHQIVNEISLGEREDVDKKIEAYRDIAKSKREKTYCRYFSLGR